MTTAVVKFGEDVLVSVFESDQVVLVANEPVKDGVLDEIYKTLSSVKIDQVIFLIRSSVYDESYSGTKELSKLSEGKFLGYSEADAHKLESLAQKIGIPQYRINCSHELYGLIDMKVFLAVEDYYEGNVMISAVENGKVLGVEICKPPVIETVLQSMGKRFGVQEVVSPREYFKVLDENIKNISEVSEVLMESLRTSIAVQDIPGGWVSGNPKVVTFKPKAQGSDKLSLEKENILVVEEVDEEEDLLDQEPIVFEGLTDKDKDEIPKSDFKSFLSRRSPVEESKAPSDKDIVKLGEKKFRKEKTKKLNPKKHSEESLDVEEEVSEIPASSGKEKLSSIMVGVASFLLLGLVFSYGLGYYADWKSSTVVEDKSISSEVASYMDASNNGKFMFSEKYYSVKTADSFGLTKSMLLTPTQSELEVVNSDPEALEKFKQALETKYTVSPTESFSGDPGDGSSSWLTLE